MQKFQNNFQAQRRIRGERKMRRLILFWSLRTLLPEMTNCHLLLAMMETDTIESFNQDGPHSAATPRRVDATGFVQLNALRLKAAAKVGKKK